MQNMYERTVVPAAAGAPAVASGAAAPAQAAATPAAPKQARPGGRPPTLPVTVPCWACPRSGLHAQHEDLRDYSPWREKAWPSR